MPAPVSCFQRILEDAVTISKKQLYRAKRKTTKKIVNKNTIKISVLNKRQVI